MPIDESKEALAKLKIEYEQLKKELQYEKLAVRSLEDQRTALEQELDEQKKLSRERAVLISILNEDKKQLAKQLEIANIEIHSLKDHRSTLEGNIERLNKHGREDEAVSASGPVKAIDDQLNLTKKLEFLNLEVQSFEESFDRRESRQSGILDSKNDSNSFPIHFNLFSFNVFKMKASKLDPMNRLLLPKSKKPDPGRRRRP